ncbi:MAG: selenocysteine-specific translation elongation factor, partial [Gemmatimonadetes bacterium]|nr:selenocysteine-specific translation elongation factor [Gemmatimonadota bacterium]
VLVVAADEGAMPQTREHLDIIDFLGVEHGVVALTKADLVDEETREIAALDVEEALAGTVLANAPILPVSGTTGEGIPELREKLVELAARVPARSDEGPYRLPVDRAFVMEGFGTVVTGTGFSGRVKVGDRLDVLPAGKSIRVRRLQVHGKEVEVARAGERTALALHGVTKDEIPRGQQLVTPESLFATSMIDVRVRCSPRWVRPIRNRERVRFHLGSSEDLARIILLDRDELGPGEDCLAQLRFETPIVPALGDRFVLRSYSPLHTMAGGTIVDPRPTKHRRFRDDELESIERREGGGSLGLLLETVVESGLAGVKTKDLVEATSLARADVDAAVAAETERGTLRVAGNGRIFSADVWRIARRTILEECGRYRDRWPLRWGPTREELRGLLGQGATIAVIGELVAQLAAEGEVRLAGEKVRAGGGEIVFEGPAAVERDRIASAFRRGGMTPPGLSEVLSAGANGVTSEVVSALVDSGELAKITEEILFHRESFERAVNALRIIFARDGNITVGAFRDELGISRKYAVPLLEHFDALRLTRRDGDVRILRQPSQEETTE